MPFTPLHLGPGLAIKGLIPHHFSFSMFTLANVAMDVEPLYRMWRIEFPVHGFSHSLTGALLIGACVAVVGRGAITAGWRIYERLGNENTESYSMTSVQAWVGALLGTGSHLVLDAVMHADMHPFSPFTDANPLLAVEWYLPLHLGLVLAGMAGMVLILTRAAWQQKSAGALDPSQREELP